MNGANDVHSNYLRLKWSQITDTKWLIRSKHVPWIKSKHQIENNNYDNRSNGSEFMLHNTKYWYHRIAAVVYATYSNSYTCQRTYKRISVDNVA